MVLLKELTIKFFIPLFALLYLPLCALERESAGANAELKVQEPADTGWSLIDDTPFTSGRAGFFRLLELDNTLNVIYKDHANDGKATVLTRLEDQWSGPVDVTPGEVDALDAVNHDNTIYVAYAYTDNNSRLSVRRLNGDSWDLVGSEGITPAGIAEPKLLPRTTNIAVVYQDSFNLDKLSAQTHNGVSWLALGAAGVTTDAASILSVAEFDSNVDVLLRDAASGGRLALYEYSTGWDSIDLSGFGTSPISDTSAFVYNGGNYLLFQELTGDYPMIIGQDGGDWNEVFSLDSLQKRMAAVSVLATDERLILAYSDEELDGRLSVIEWSGSTWEFLGSQGFSNGAGSAIHMIIFEEELYLTYSDSDQFGRGHLLRYDSIEL